MDVLIVTQYFWPENFPINDLAIGLKGKGYEVSVLTGMPNYPEGRFFSGYRGLDVRRDTYQGVTVVRVPMIPKGSGNALRMYLYYLSLATSASLSIPFLFSSRPDLVFVYQPSPITVALPALVLKRLEHIPVWMWVQDIWPETLAATGMVRSPLLLEFVGKLVKYVYRGCDRILVQSKAFKDRIRSMGVPEEKIFYFPNSAQDYYRPVQIESDPIETSLLPRGFRVMFAGNIGKAQDFPTILGAAEKLKALPEIRWILLGDGSMRPWVEREVKARCLEKTVHLLGRHPAETMPRLFSLADALLVSLKRNPIFALTIPSKVQSYMASGKPIVAALDGEGARVIEEAGGGMTVPAGDADALAAAVLKMYKTPQPDLEKMGHLSRKYFEKHFERNSLLERLDHWMKDEVDK
jgi:glycosyltransferase involved in cell wall biosynthesis